MIDRIPTRLADLLRRLVAGQPALGPLDYRLMSYSHVPLHASGRAHCRECGDLIVRDEACISFAYCFGGMSHGDTRAYIHLHVCTTGWIVLQSGLHWQEEGVYRTVAEAAAQSFILGQRGSARTRRVVRVPRDVEQEADDQEEG